MILVENGKRQPTGELLAEIRGSTVGVSILVDGERVDAEIFRFNPPED
jgi:hypothetical protein